MEFALAAFSILLAVAVPLGIEWLRRPMLVLSPVSADPASAYAIVHVKVQNRALADRGRTARFFSRWLTATAADGCTVELRITGTGAYPALSTFPGKWSSTGQPIRYFEVTDNEGQRHLDWEYDPEGLVGIHEVRLQPGPTGEQVAVAIRVRGKSGPAYAFDAKRIYLDAEHFPRDSTCELPPGRYRVRAQARAGEVASPVAEYVLEVPAAVDDLVLTEAEGKMQQESWTNTNAN